MLAGMDPNRSFGEMPLPLFAPAPDDVVQAVPTRGKTTPSYLADHRARLRDRFMQGGAAAMPDYEMLELILFRAIPRQDMKPLARRLIEAFGDFNRVLTATPARLQAIDGVGPAVVTELKIMRPPPNAWPAPASCTVPCCPAGRICWITATPPWPTGRSSSSASCIWTARTS